jgi:hypothetical protein
VIDIEDLESVSRPESPDVNIPLKRALVVENSESNSHSTQGPKRATTQLKEVPRVRVAFASASASARTVPKPFVPLDPASIRRGFQEGGASSRKEDLKKGTYDVVLIYSLGNSVDTVGVQLQVLSQRRFGSFHFLELPSRNLCLTRHKSLLLTIH